MDRTQGIAVKNDGLAEAVSRYGRSAKAKLANPAISGAPEDQLRSPLEALIEDLAVLAGHAAGSVTPVGETRMAALKTRPDYAVTRRNALIGFIEVKAPGKGADPRRFQDPHDKEQWTKLQALPNLIYTDGNAFSLWRDGTLTGPIVRLDGDVEQAGPALAAPPELAALFSDFLQWNPVPPRTAKALAEVAARLCRLLRDEVTEQLALDNPAFRDLRDDWRKLLFPDATDAVFADGYAQAVTFGLLMARAGDIPLTGGLAQVALKLRESNLLIGTALRLLTDDAENQKAIKTSLDTLTRVLDAVHWPAISKGDADAWLYFYEHFLSIYDNRLRKLTGSYYTPPEVVRTMARLVDDVLRAPSGFALPQGLASEAVTLADPALGTGTYLLGVLRHIADTVAADEGDGAVPGRIGDALKRLIGFEIQFGPFAVAQLRLFAEVVTLMGDAEGAAAASRLRLFVTDTLGNPNEEEEWLPAAFRPISESRRAANRIKRQEPITVVLGNPPYKEKAKGRGGWIEAGAPPAVAAPLAAWQPPREWGVGAHAKHLRNLYVYFWRWATWKVFGDGAPPGTRNGVVCFITVAGFLNGPGFEKMRADLRRDADDIWVIDCSPEGHQPEVATRVFQGVQHPVCIVLVARTGRKNPAAPARVRFRALPMGRREEKFVALAAVMLEGEGWVDCPAAPRAPFLPAAGANWGALVPLGDIFAYDGSGVMPGRTWVIAPDAETLRQRWARLLAEKDAARKEVLFHPHLVGGKPGDRHVNRAVRREIAGPATPAVSIARDGGPMTAPIRYGFRSFDRQWIIPDNRVINRPNPTLWALHSPGQIYLTALVQHAPTSGPALSATNLIPDLHHYKGSFGGRAFPLWLDEAAGIPNIRPGLLAALADAYGHPIAAEDLFAAVAALAAHPGYVTRFREDLVQPGLRIPITADAALFAEAAALGREVLWLHSFGERFVDPSAGRPAGPPRVAEGGPRIPKDGAIPTDAARMPDRIGYDADKRRLFVGTGHVDGVAPAVWAYEVSGKQVLTQWFSYRGRDRSRPLIGDKRAPSPLQHVQPEGWLPEYTTELLNLLHVLGRLVALELTQDLLLERVCAGPLLTSAALREAGAFTIPDEIAARIAVLGRSSEQASLLD